MLFYVYLLYSPSGNKYYVGQTDDLTYRLLVHNELGSGSYTSRYRPWELKWWMEVPSRSLAMQVEQYIKGRKSRTYLERLIGLLPGGHDMR